MNQEGQVDILVQTLTSFWERIASYMTSVLLAIGLIIVGFLVAKLARTLVSRFLKLVKFDRFVERSGLESFFTSSPHPVTLSGILGGIVYILIILMTLIQVADLLNLAIVSQIFERVVLYLPKVILAVLILVFGVIFSRFINNLTFGLLSSMKVGSALQISTVCEYLVQIFVWFFALEQVLETQLLLVAFAILFGAFCLACAIAFGFAGRKQAERLLEKGFDRIEKKE